MHVIKNDSYFFAFNKKATQELVKRFENKKLAVIDFEAFQFFNQDKPKFNKITINDIPYTVCINTLVFNSSTNQFESSNEQVYQFCDNWQTETELLDELEKMAIFIANYVKDNQIERFIYMADYLEKQALEFFVSQFGYDLNLSQYLLIKGYDLYNYFFKPENFRILSYKYKVQDMIKTFMYKYGDEYENFQIGQDGMKHFRDLLKGKKPNILDFEKVKKHSWIDLQKGTDLINYICLLANWPDDQILNQDLLEKENSI